MRRAPPSWNERSSTVSETALREPYLLGTLEKVLGSVLGTRLHWWISGCGLRQASRNVRCSVAIGSQADMAGSDWPREATSLCSDFNDMHVSGFIPTGPPVTLHNTLI